MDVGQSNNSLRKVEPVHMAHPRPLILFDGVCNLCNSTVQWVIERDDEGRFHFATLQSDAARRELQETIGKDEIDTIPDSIVLLDSDGVHTRSAAALRIARALGFPFALLGLHYHRTRAESQRQYPRERF